MEYKVKATAIDYRGYGITKDLGKVGFIKGLLPGEIAKIKITREKKNYYEGKVVELLKRSKYRLEEKVTLDNNPLSHLDNAMQLKFQDDITLETLMRAGFRGFKKEPILTDLRYYNYRNRALFHVNLVPYIVLGGYKERSRDFIPIDNLITAEPAINKILNTLNEYYKEKRIICTDLRSISIRSNYKEEVMITFITETDSLIPLELYRFLKDNDKVKSVYQNILDDKKHNFGSKNIHLAKDTYLKDKIGEYNFYLYPNSFFQVNRQVSELAYEKIKDKYLTEEDIVIDAYAGMASIGQYVSHKVHKVYSIESNNESIESAKRSIKENIVTNLTLIQGDVIKEVPRLLKEASAIIFDPPRSGLNEEILNKVNSSNIKKVIYMSCNLKTLQRDLKLLTNYKLVEVTPVKMFFQTVETETIAYLRRK